MPQGLGLWVAAASLVAFVLTGLDKRRSKRGDRRIRERTLLVWALVGGTLGLMLGMVAFNHKLRKGRFLAWLAGVAAVQVLLAWAAGHRWFLFGLDGGHGSD